MDIPQINVNTVDVEISDIKIIDVSIPPVRSVIDNLPDNVPMAPPVVVEVGVPVVDVPGCVEAHEVDENNELEADDPKGTKVFCDGDLPSFNPIDYKPKQLTYTKETPAPVPNTKTPEKDKKKEEDEPGSNIKGTPPVKSPTIETPKIDCPSREQELLNPIGKVLEGNKKIVAYELVGNRCLEVTETLSIPQQIITSIPNAGMITTTGSIAAVATTSALLAKPLADILLKVVKPVVKKVIKKIAAIRGKQVKVMSVSERINEQRDRNRAIKELRQTLKSKTK